MKSDIISLKIEVDEATRIKEETFPCDHNLYKNNNNQKMNFGTSEMEISLMYF